ncbi:MAG: stage II sporulation protein P [Bacillota bacterium]
MASPFLVAYVVVVSTTVGLLVNRNPRPEEAVPALAAPGPHAAAREREVQEPPLWLQLFRPSPPTARILLRTGLPTLPLAGSGARREERNLLILWTGRAGDRPQSLFQVMLPFLRSQKPPTTEQAKDDPRPPSPSEPPPDRAQPSPRPAPVRKEPAVLNGGLPLVGIYHTHDYESYASEFPELKIAHERDLMRVASYDHSRRTIVNVGAALAHHLRDLGVTTVHAPFKHQELGYDYAYQSSRNTARQILKTAPSVKILMDLHRDGTWGLDSTTTIDGKPVARIRCIIGAREDQAHWEKNKAFCDNLIARMEKAHPGLTLPTLTANYRYNQDLMPGAILLEIGNATNRYEEAERAVRYLAEALVQMIRERAYPH